MCRVITKLVHQEFSTLFLTPPSSTHIHIRIAITEMKACSRPGLATFVYNAFFSQSITDPTGPRKESQSYNAKQPGHGGLGVVHACELQYIVKRIGHETHLIGFPGRLWFPTQRRHIKGAYPFYSTRYGQFPSGEASIRNAHSGVAPSQHSSHTFYLTFPLRTKHFSRICPRDSLASGRDTNIIKTTS